VRKLALLILVAVTAASVILGWIWLVHRPSEVEKAVLLAAEAGAFPRPRVRSLSRGANHTTDRSSAESKRSRPFKDRTCTSASWGSRV
jgi:hypothetical protein